jgi:hypothetical protein
VPDKRPQFPVAVWLRLLSLSGGVRDLTGADAKLLLVMLPLLDEHGVCHKGVWQLAAMSGSTTRGFYKATEKLKKLDLAARPKWNGNPEHHPRTRILNYTRQKMDWDKEVLALQEKEGEWRKRKERKESKEEKEGKDREQEAPDRSCPPGQSVVPSRAIGRALQGNRSCPPGQTVVPSRAHVDSPVNSLESLSPSDSPPPPPSSATMAERPLPVFAAPSGGGGGGFANAEELDGFRARATAQLQNLAPGQEVPRIEQILGILTAGKGNPVERVAALASYLPQMKKDLATNRIGLGAIHYRIQKDFSKRLLRVRERMRKSGVPSEVRPALAPPSEAEASAALAVAGIPQPTFSKAEAAAGDSAKHDAGKRSASTKLKIETHHRLDIEAKREKLRG